ncbi:SANT and BTB domain regulator of class switch recombination [Pieris brassicae]|uniref:SANT and BTB domain regulator of class switch recombination n=1 Tax=Pieris brassicae TaxID=7116 RepID=UPI001E65EFAA|nr:SANT and BTB domain regulator of class switch recombination [Pieris brassicae]
MASPNPDIDASSMFMDKGDGRKSKSPIRSGSPRNRVKKKERVEPAAEVITVKDFFDFMKTAYQVYEHLEGSDDDGSKINWEELTKLTVLNHVIEQQERDLLQLTVNAIQKPIISKSETAIEPKYSITERVEKRYSCTEIEGNRRSNLNPEIKVEMLGVWTEANLNCKLNDVINEGILDSILPYLVGYKKPAKTTSVYAPIMKKTVSSTSADIKKPASFDGFINEKDSRDRLGRRKSSVIAAQEKSNQKQDGDVEIHVCDEVKGLKKDFRCPQKLLVTKMGYFADVTAGQRLEDMDISVHCDIQIFDWLMRWVKRDTILVADWPLLDPHNVVPILVSASFLQMEPLLHDCLIYCHAHMNDIVKTTTNLACLSDALLTRLAAMYTNVELEGIKDRKDKIQSRLYCKMILSLAEPVPETLRGHYASLATLFKCSKCNKLLGRHIAEQVPCQPAAMRIDRRGNVLSSHNKDPSWSINDYITWLYGELRSWRRVYWRLWADCHFLRCQLCDSYFPAYQMEWCSHHEQNPHMFGVEGRAALPAGRYPCCGERAYRFETITRNTGCQFREHVPDERLATDASVMEIYSRYRDIIAMRPPQLMFPERLTRLVAREPGEEVDGRLQCKEVFWWEGIQLVPPRQPLGLLGKLYTSNSKFNQNTRPGSPVISSLQASMPSLAGNCFTASASPERIDNKVKRNASPKGKQGTGTGDVEVAEEATDSDESEQSSDSARSDEDTPPRRPRTRTRVPAPANRNKSRRWTATTAGRVWAATVSARSNQDGQRRFEERAAAHMKATLARRHHYPTKPKQHPGGVYAKLEADWREKHGQQKVRNLTSAKIRSQPTKYK